MRPRNIVRVLRVLTDISRKHWWVYCCTWLLLGAVCGLDEVHGELCTVDAVPSVDVTPNPSCLAKVTISWNFSESPFDTAQDELAPYGISGATATKVEWEVKTGGMFTNLNGRENGANVKAHGIKNGLQGSQQIDLRNYGPVLDGTPYYFRATALTSSSAAVAERGTGEPYELPGVVYESFTTTQVPGTSKITLHWSLPPNLAGCVDRVFYEVKTGGPFAQPTGRANTRIRHGTGQQIPTGSNDINLPGPGEYHVRLVGKWRGGQARHDVGLRGLGKPVSVTASGPAAGGNGSGAGNGGPSISQKTPKPEVSWTSGCPALRTFAWDVSSIPGATGALWELKVGSPFGASYANRKDPNRDKWGTGGVTGSETIDLRQFGPFFTQGEYYFRVVARQDNHDIALRSDPRGLDFIPRAFPVSVTPSAGNPWQVTMAWGSASSGGGSDLSAVNLGQLKACADAIFYEVNKDPFSSPGRQGGRIYAGRESGTSGSKTFNLEQYGAGTYYFRVVGKYGGNGPKNDIGVRRVGAGPDSVSITLPTTPDE